MADILRALAAVHPELLTRFCECNQRHQKLIQFHAGLAAEFVPACVACSGSGRRLATLEELLEAIEAIKVEAFKRSAIAMPYRPGYPREAAVYELLVAVQAPPQRSLREAAACRLIELGAGRG